MDYTGCRDFAPAMENHKEENMEHEVATRIMKGLWMEILQLIFRGTRMGP